jgi:hypothetical protein
LLRLRDADASLPWLKGFKMGLQPSASRTALLLLCPRPFDPEIEADPDVAGEPARYGSAFHFLIAACLRSSSKKPLEKAAAYAREVDRAAREYDVKGTVHELAGHVKGSVKVLRNWLDREKLQVAEVERAYAIKPKGDGHWMARTIPPHDEDHRYDIKGGELPGTIDLIAVSSNHSRAVVVDHKTGGEDHGFARPASMSQMRTLGLVCGPPNVERPDIEVGIFHADRRGLPIVYAEPYETSDQRSHTVELHQALSRIGSGFLRPGTHCARCPARITCPAHAADLLSESAAALVSTASSFAAEPIDPRGLLAPLGGNVSLEVRAGALYELLKKFRALEKAGSEEIKRLVRSGAVIETREGKVLTLQTQSYETLSKKSVLEALGKIAGEKELKRLREKGAIREATREMLVGEK